MEVNREELLGRLKLMTPGLAKRAIIEQSDCITFQDGRMLTFNDEASCSDLSPLGDIEGSINGNKLIAVLGKMSSKLLDIEVKDGTLLLKGGGERSGIRMEEVVALDASAISDPIQWSKLPKKFAVAVDTIAACVGTDETFQLLVHIHIHPKFMEACDNYQIIRYPMKTGVKESMIVRGVSMKAAADMKAKEVSLTDGWIHFRGTGELILSSRVGADSYPDLTDSLDVTGEKIEIPVELLESLDKAQLFSSDDIDNDHVRVSLKNGRIKLLGDGPEGWYAKQMKTSYKGDPLSFQVASYVLAELGKRSNQCEVAEGKLKVEGDGYTYIACTASE